MFVVSLEVKNASEAAQLLALIELHQVMGKTVTEITEIDAVPMLDVVDRLLDNLRTWTHYAPKEQGWSMDDVGMVKLKLTYLAGNLTKAIQEMEEGGR